jgi:REP element-mobilizing transposase RayT
MPDHLHLLLIPKGERTLSAIMKSIKGYSSREINKLTGRAGPLWQQSFYDRMIRSESQLRSVIEYIEQNATKAALSDTPEAYPFSSAGKPT